MAMRNPDDALVVVFKSIPMENATKSLKEGRPIFDDAEMCEVRSPGSKDVKVFPATAFTQWLDDPFTGQQTKQTYAERFSHQYMQFKAKQTQTKTGTPLDYAPFLSEARRAELRAQNVYTVEQLAAIDGNELKNLGPGGREMKNKAIELIDESRAAAPNKQLAAELEAMKARNAVLEEDMALLKSRDVPDEFEDMTQDQLREYIAANTGHSPQGNINKKTLMRMAASCRPTERA